MRKTSPLISNRMSRPLVVANWKMHHLRISASDVISSLIEIIKCNTVFCDIVICPPSTLLIETSKKLTNSPVSLGAQDCHSECTGAFTGDISAEMLVDAGCEYVIVGHSERRLAYGETDRQVKAKAEAAHRAGLIPIICIGETAEDRKRGQTLDTVERQLLGSLPDNSIEKNIVVAYEPVWAIGSGVTPTVAEIADVHNHVLNCLGDLQPDDSKTTRILYGGSVNPETAPALVNIDCVNGALVGGASLSADPFWRVVKTLASA